MSVTDPRLGLTVVHRRYVPFSAAHYAGHLVDGAYSLGLFGDVATEVCIRADGDEGLFASYSDVQFRAPVRAGDLLEVTAEVVRVGSRSRTLDFRAVVVGRGLPGRSASAARILPEPIVATTATGVVVVPGPSSVGVPAVPAPVSARCLPRATTSGVSAGDTPDDDEKPRPILADRLGH